MSEDTKDVEKNNKLKLTRKDHLHTIAKAGISAVPFAGGPLAELFGKYVPSPIERRRDSFILDLDARLEQLEKSDKRFSFENLQQNESFISILLHAFQIAVRNHQKEKLQALRNAVLNTVLIPDIDHEERQMFLRYIDDFTVWHLKILTLLDMVDLSRIDEASRGLGAVAYNKMGHITRVYPELISRVDFAEEVLRQLEDRKFISNNIRNFPPSFISWTTPMGRRFLDYTNLRRSPN